MTVRLATSKDRDEFVRLANLFLKESQYPFKIDLMKLIQNFLVFVDGPEHIILVNDNGDRLSGMMVGAVTETPFSSERISTEIAWFVEEDERGSKVSLEMLNLYEKWARSQGCTFITMVDIHSLNSLQKLYERKGYTLTEKTYVKEI